MKIIFLSFIVKAISSPLLLSQADGLANNIDPQLMEKVREMVKRGVITGKEMKKHLDGLVTDVLFSSGQRIPRKSNKRYWPRLKTITSAMKRCRRKNLKSLIDQEALQFKIDEWRMLDPSVNIFYRPKKVEQTDENGDSDDEEEEEEEVEEKEEVEEVMTGESDNDITEEELIDESSSSEGEDEVVDAKRYQKISLKTKLDNSLLFVYQNEDEKRLLERYGNELSLLDATYKTTRYALPLFFLVVKTNIDYQVVATFVTESETAKGIAEALDIIKGWNPDWKPTVMMTDYSDEEIAAIGKVLGKF